MGLEGIVSKRVASRYKSGACKSWLKARTQPQYSVAELPLTDRPSDRNPEHNNQAKWR
jgi:ATP-dependent DNA ligase